MSSYDEVYTTPLDTGGMWPSRYRPRVWPSLAPMTNEEIAAEPRCEMSDLLVSACAHCRPEGDELPRSLYAGTWTPEDD